MIANVQYSNEAYFEERKKYLTSHGGYAYGKLSELFERMKGENQMEKTIIYNSENVSGNHISHCYNVHASEDVIDSKNSKFINTIGK